MTARWVTADVFDGLATLEDHSVDLVVTSPPFLALRSYLPSDHPDKDREIGSESTPAEFIDVLLAVTAELRRVLAPHGSIAIELGDTYAGSGGAGGDYNPDGLREGQLRPDGSGRRRRVKPGARPSRGTTVSARRDRIEVDRQWTGGSGWPEPKSKTLIPELYRVALAYGINPLTGQPSPAGRWRVRNTVTWCRPNPPVGALGDKWRPATSDVVVACVSGKRYWDDLATRHPSDYHRESLYTNGTTLPGQRPNTSQHTVSSGGAPLRDYWPDMTLTLREAVDLGWLDPGDMLELPPGGYEGAHYAVYPEALVVPFVKAMCPERVCVVCGEPSRRIVETSYERLQDGQPLTEMDGWRTGRGGIEKGLSNGKTPARSISETTGWSDCGHNDWRPGHVLDPFAGSGTTGAVATGHGRNATLIDLDPRNLELARQRIGMFLTEAGHDKEPG